MTSSGLTLESLDSLTSLKSSFSSEPPATLTATFVNGLTHSNQKGSQENLVELRFSASNLLNADILSLSDPFAVVYMENGGIAKELGRTETILDDLNPTWTSALVVPKGAIGDIVVDVYDRDGKSENLLKHDHLGRAKFSLCQILHDGGFVVAALHKADEAAKKFHFTPYVPRGHVKISAEILRKPCGKRVEFRMKIAGLKKGRRQTIQFWQVQRLSEDGNFWVTIYRSEDGTKMDSYGYMKYKSIRMGEQLLCNEDKERKLRFVFFVRHARKSHVAVAQFICDTNLLYEKMMARLLPGDLVENNARFSFVEDTSLYKKQNFGEFYVEDAITVGDTTVVQILVDLNGGREYTSTAEDTSVPERVIRNTPSFIKLH